MEYLIRYYAWTDTGNGYSLDNHKQIEDGFEDLCREIALLENYYRNDKDFSYEVFALHKVKNEEVENNETYLKEKCKFIFEQNIKELKEKISSKKREISNHEQTKEKYGKWEHYEEQVLQMKNDLSELETILELGESK